MPLKLKPKSSNNLDLEHQRLITLINSMADAVIAVDDDIRIVQFNSSALNILDINNISMLAPLNSLLKPVDSNNQPVDIEVIIKEAKIATTNRDLRLFYKDGSYINLFISIAPVHLGFKEKGDNGYVMLIRDITREKSLEEERDEFISVVSHELRTPIAIAEGNLSNAKLIAEKSGDIEVIKKAINDSHSQILFLADMINDLSTLSRAERGVLTLDIVSIDIRALFHDLVEGYKADASAKGIELKDVISDEVTNLSNSQLYVKEILQNFITNAIKYTEQGEIVLHAEKGDNSVILSVHDTGIGISKAEQERVFDKFYRSEDVRARKSNGTGLGLYVTIKLARLIHGSLSLQSELNKGSTFTLVAPNLKSTPSA